MTKKIYIYTLFLKSLLLSLFLTSFLGGFCGDQGGLDAKDAEIAKLRKTLDETDEKVGELEQQLGAQHVVAIAPLKSELDKQKRQLATASAREAEAQREINTNKNQISQKQTEIENLKRDATGNAAEIARKEQEISSLNSQNTLLEQQRIQAVTDKKRLVGELNTLNAQLARLEEALENRQFVIPCVCTYPATSPPQLNVSTPISGVGPNSIEAGKNAGTECSKIHAEGQLTACGLVVDLGAE